MSIYDQQEQPKILSREASEDIYNRIVGYGSGGGHTRVYLDSRWVGSLRWARNKISTAGEITDHTVRIVRMIRGAEGSSMTNKLDESSLRMAVKAAEAMIVYEQEDLDFILPPPKQAYLSPQLWSDSTVSFDATQRSSSARSLVKTARDANLLAAGYMEVRAITRGIYNTNQMNAYYAATHAEYSVTVRNALGTGSGWAGVDKQDWASIDASAISRVALEKCVASVSPKAIEPGRYVTVLEPQAVSDLFFMVVVSLDRTSAEAGSSVFSDSRGQSRLGKSVFDPRITVSTDPMDLECGYIPFNGEGYPYKPVTWIDKGILKELSYDRSYALQMLGHGIPQPNPYAYRMAGGSSSLEEMISNTRRGLLVTRLDGMGIIDYGSLLCSGVTRDGLWLIENGKITYPAKNMRFSESPMFVFNNVEQVGPAQRVYSTYPSIAPSIKVRDFNFTSMADAV